MGKTEEFIVLRDQLQPFIPILDRASEIIRNERVSRYPIMVVHKQDLELGIPFETGPIPGGWQIQASTLEEFVARQLIDDSRIDDFRDLYRQHENHVCLFILSSLGAQFVFFEKNHV